jgi:probable addiction module antidote protein
MSNGDEEFNVDDLESLGLTEFDPTQHLTSVEAIAAYMSEIIATGHTELFQSAMKDVIKAYGMGKVAEKANITREGAYKALREGSKPRLETIVALLDAIGLQFAIIPKAAHDDNSYALAA